jgi:thiamine biosynthesis lipoprotein
MESVLLSSGGSIRAIGKPLDGERERWGIGIAGSRRPPSSPMKQVYLDVSLRKRLFRGERAEGTSDTMWSMEKILHHIIDPETLMPADYYRAVTVKTDHAGTCRFPVYHAFSSALRCRAALSPRAWKGVDALWVMPDGEIRTTQGMQKIMRSKGASGARAD